MCAATPAIEPPLIQSASIESVSSAVQNTAANSGRRTRSSCEPATSSQTAAPPAVIETSVADQLTE